MDDIDLKDRGANDAHDQRGALGGQHHPTNPWDAEIDVTLTSDGTPPSFQIDTCLPLDNDGNIIFYNNGRPGFKIKFRFYDNTNNGNGSGYAFPNPPTLPMWSSQGQGCPTQAAQWSDFTSLNVQDQGATLNVRNTNASQTLFGYALIVTNGTKTLTLDPGGSNMNGNQLR